MAHSWEAMNASDTGLHPEEQFDTEVAEPGPISAPAAQAEDAPAKAPGLQSTATQPGVGAFVGSGGPALPVGGQRRLGRPQHHESAIEELTRLVGNAADSAQQGTLQSSAAVMRIAAETANTRLRESEQLAKRLVADAQDSLRRREVDA